MLRVFEEIGIPTDFPLSLGNLSNRVRRLLHREHVDTVGQLIQWFSCEGQLDGHHVRGMGRRSREELQVLRVAFLTRKREVLGRFLPLTPNGHGVSFASAIAQLFTRLSTRDLEFLLRRHRYRQTIARASDGVCGPRGRAGPIERCFLRSLRLALEWFCDEKQLLWNAWEEGIPLVEHFGDALNYEQKQVAASAVTRLFCKSTEGKAIQGYRRQQFRAWLDELRTCPDFYSTGVRVGLFLRAKGAEQRQTSFFAFLAKKAHVEVQEEAGLVLSRRRMSQRTIPVNGGEGRSPEPRASVPKRNTCTSCSGQPKETLSMPIKFNCSGCGLELSAAGDLAGKKCRCRSCGATMQIPEIIELGPEQETSNVGEAPSATEGETAPTEGQLDSDGATSAGACSQDRAADGLRFCAETFKLLGDETRVRVLNLLSDGPKSVSALVAALGIGQPLVSHHLGLLRNVRMVVAQRRGKAVFYDIDREWLGRTMDFLRRMESRRDA